jgi:hypothetical protein
VDKVTQHKDLQDLRVIPHQDHQGQKDQQDLRVIKDRLHLQDRRVSRDLRVTKVLKDLLVTHHKVHRDLKVTHLQVIQAEGVMVDLRVMLETQHKDLQDLQDLVDLEGIKDLQETREPRVRKDQLHLQGRLVTRDPKVRKDQKDLKVVPHKVIRDLKDHVVLPVEQVMPVLVQQDLQVTQQKVQGEHKELRVLRDLKVSKDLSDWLLVDLQGRRVQSVIQVVVKRAKKEPTDLQDQKVHREPKDLREIKDKKVRPQLVI